MLNFDIPGLQLNRLWDPSWSCSWIYSYICNQFSSLLTLWVRIPLRRSVLCTWLAIIGLVLVYGVSRHFQQYFSYIVTVSFIGGGNRSTRRKPPTCNKSMTNCPFVLFLLVIVLSVLLRFTDFDYPFGIFRLFLGNVQMIYCCTWR
jgi:ABC-type spermidine/putrescine transport system permease subunit II